MGRIGRGWQLSKESWAIVNADRSLLVFPVIAGIGALIAVAVFGGAGAGVYPTSEPLAIVIGLAGAAGAVLILLGVAFFLVGAVVQNALMAVFKVALYRFATDDRLVGQFERPQLEAAFRPRGRAARATI
jgi:hypothetical protein